MYLRDHHVCCKFLQLARIFIFMLEKYIDFCENCFLGMSYQVVSQVMTFPDLEANFL
jgi:hypothetical protein